MAAHLLERPVKVRLRPWKCAAVVTQLVTQPGHSRTVIAGAIDVRDGIPRDRHVSRIVGVSNLHEREQVEIMPSEPVEVLKEELYLGVGEPLFVSFVAHVVTLRSIGVW